MSDEPPSEEDRQEGLAPLAAAEQAPFPLFGLTEEFRGTRDLNGVGQRGEGKVVYHVTLSHGLWTDTRVDVSVIGPMHWPVAGGEASLDPLQMIAVELLNHTGADLASAEELIRAAEGVLRRGFEDGEVRVDGELRPFRFMRDGAHWAALHEIQPDHLLYIVASNVAPSDIELTRLDNLARYA